MDEILKKLIENEKNAREKLERCTTDTEFNLQLNILNNATNTLNSYISYKKAEEGYNKAYNKTEKYYNIINEMREVKC